MNGTVSTLSIVFMAAAGVLSVCFPVALFVYFRRKKGADVLPFFVGCAVMLLFAFVQESLAHSVVLGSPAGAAIRGNVWLYALYGGLMAGLFEETGRYLAFKTVLKKSLSNNANALMYGAGHGGFEAIVILGITSINNIAWSVMINSGSTGAITGALSGDALTQAEAVIGQLTTTPPALFLLGGVERVLAIILHIALSVLVWFAVKKSRIQLFLLSIFCHFFIDAVTVLLSGFGVNALIIECAIAVITAVIVVISRKAASGAVSDDDSALSEDCD